MLALATLWSLVRVYCGVHYPLDIAAGAAVGSLTACLIARRIPLLDRVYDWFISLGERLFMT